MTGAIVALALVASSASAQMPAAKYLDAESRAVVHLSTVAYSSLRSLKAVSVSARGMDTLWRSGRSIRERQPTVEWTYVSGILTLRDRRKNVLYSGKSKFSDVPDYVAKLYGSSDPLMRMIARGRNPLRVIITPDATVRHVGSVVMNGATHDILQIRAGSLRTSAWIRTRDHLLTRLESETRDKAGRVVTRGARSLEYQNVGRPMPPTFFHLEGRTLPLARLLKLPK